MNLSKGLLLIFTPTLLIFQNCSAPISAKSNSGSVGGTDAMTVQGGRDIDPCDSCDPGDPPPATGELTDDQALNALHVAYWAGLGRAPDSAGINTYQSRIATEGKNGFRDVLKILVTSGEYKNRFRPATNPYGLKTANLSGASANYLYSSLFARCVTTSNEYSNMKDSLSRTDGDRRNLVYSLVGSGEFDSNWNRILNTASFKPMACALAELQLQSPSGGSVLNRNAFSVPGSISTTQVKLENRITNIRVIATGSGNITTAYTTLVSATPVPVDAFTWYGPFEPSELLAHGTIYFKVKVGSATRGFKIKFVE